MCGFGGRPLLGRSVAILEFCEAANLDVVHVEGLGRARQFWKRQDEVAWYRAEFDRLRAASGAPSEM